MIVKEGLFVGKSVDVGGAKKRVMEVNITEVYIV
jgi:hypothetical protein